MERAVNYAMHFMITLWSNTSPD